MTAYDIPEGVSTLTHHLTGEITDKKARQTIARLEEMHDVGAHHIWQFTITSDGGLISAADAIYSELHSHSRRGGGSHYVITRVRGQVSSAATTIFQAGDWRVMGKMDRLLLHEPRLSVDSAPLTQLRHHVDDLDEWLNHYVEAHMPRATLDRHSFRHLLRDQDWVVYGDEALELGLADGIG